MLQINVDYREKVLFDILTDELCKKERADIELISTNLQIGDIQILYENVEFLFERKTMSDWAASIKDGRLKEQKARMLASVPASRIMYLMEGCPGLGKLVNSMGNVGGMKSSVFVGSWISIAFKDGIHVTPTKDTTETAQWVLEVAERVLKDPAKFGIGEEVGVDGNDKIDNGYMACLKTKKRKIDNITPDVCYRLMLSQIPNISMKIACDIAAIYPTMERLYSVLGSLEREERVKKVCEIQGIGAKKASVIIAHLFPQSI